MMREMELGDNSLATTTGDNLINEYDIWVSTRVKIIHGKTKNRIDMMGTMELGQHDDEESS